MNNPVQWNPRDYAASSSSQARWGTELIARLNLRGNEHLLDVGCGDGKLTVELARRVPRGRVMGMDRSPDMIAYARQAYPSEMYPNLQFIQMDAREIRLPGTYDVVFSNAALHWVDDHQSFLKGVAAVLHHGGTLVVSCGGRGNAADVFRAVRLVMRTAPWRACFRSLRKPYFFYGAEDYEKWLPESGFKPVTVQLVPKEAVHASEADFAAWFRTTWMPYTQRVPEGHRDEFIAAVIQQYLMTNPPDAAGAVHVRMMRLELDAVRV